MPRQIQRYGWIPDHPDQRDYFYTLDANGSGTDQTMRVAKAKSARPNPRLIRIPKL
jgi:hypothetical protein